MIASDSNRRSFAVDQGGKRHHRIDCAVRRLALRPLYEVHVRHFVRQEALEVDAMRTR